MKKFLTLAGIAAVALTFAACSNGSSENTENPEATTDTTESAAQEIANDLNNGTPVEVDVEGAQVIDQANGTQEVQTEETITPEQAQ